MSFNQKDKLKAEKPLYEIITQNSGSWKFRVKKFCVHFGQLSLRVFQFVHSKRPPFTFSSGRQLLRKSPQRTLSPIKLKALSTNRQANRHHYE